MAAVALATLLAWLGAAIMVLSEGRRGLGAGLALAGLGLGLGLAAGGHEAGAIAVAAGAAGAALLGQREGAAGWRLMPPGSTPRVILSAICLVIGLAGGSLVGGATVPGRIAAIIVVLLSGARLMGAPDRQSALAAGGLLALGLGSLGGDAAAVLGALAALGLQLLPSRRSVSLVLGAAGLAATAVVAWSPSALTVATHLAAPRPARALLVASVLSLALAAGLAPPARRRDLLAHGGMALGVLAVAVALPDLFAVAVTLVLLAGLSAAWPGRLSFESRLRGPALAALLIGLGDLLLRTGGSGPLSRAGAVALALGLAAAAGVLPYQGGLDLDDAAAGSSLIWTGLFGPVLALGVTARLVPGLGREQAVFQAALVALGLLNLAWGVLGAGRAAEGAVAWRCSFLADWGLALVGLGLVAPGGPGAYLLLLSVVVVRLPMSLCARPVLAGQEPARGGLLSVVAAAALGGAAPFGGFPARALVLEAATRVAWPLALGLVAAMVLWLLHAYRLGSSLGRSGRPALVSAGLALGASLALGLAPGLWLTLGGY